MNKISKFFLAAVMAMTLGAAAAHAENTHRQGGPGVVVSQGNVLPAQEASASQGR